jgi:hypothetical protein
VTEGPAVASGGADTLGPESAISTATTGGTGAVGGGATGVGAAKPFGDGSEAADKRVAAGEASA